MIGLFIGVKCNEEDRALLCSLCVNTTDGCQGDCAFDNELNRCYKRGKLIPNIVNKFHCIINLILDLFIIKNFVLFYVLFIKKRAEIGRNA